MLFSEIVYVPEAAGKPRRLALATKGRHVTDGTVDDTRAS